MEIWFTNILIQQIQQFIYIDSANCSNPKVDKSSSDYPTIDIVYEKGPVGNKQIIEKYYS